MDFTQEPFALSWFLALAMLLKNHCHMHLYCIYSYSRIIIILGLRMRMTPAPLQLPCYADGARSAGVRRCSFSGSPENGTRERKREEPSIRAFYFWLDSVLFFCRSIGFYSRLTYLLSSYSQTRQPSATFSTRLWTWLCKYVRCEGPAALSPCPAPGVSANWHSERDLKLTYLSDVTNWHS